MAVQQVSASPHRLDFGPISPGQHPSKDITISFDPRALHGTPPVLVSTNSAVRLQPMPVIDQSGAGPFGAKSLSITQTYHITLSPDAPMGAIGGVLRFDVPPSDTIFSMTRIPLSGTVNGDVTAKPAVADFGKYQPGGKADLVIAVSAPKAATLKTGIVSSKDAGVTARWTDESVQESGNGKYMRHLLVHLGSGVPAGDLESGLKVRLGDGRALAIPVKGEILVAPDR